MRAFRSMTHSATILVILCTALACKTRSQETLSEVKGTSEISLAQRLENTGLLIVPPDQFEGETKERKIFPTLITGMASDWWVARDAKVVVKGCETENFYFTGQGEIGCNLGRGHMFVFAKPNGSPISVGSSPSDPSESGQNSAKFQRFTYDPSMVKLVMIEDGRSETRPIAIFEMRLTFP